MQRVDAYSSSQHGAAASSTATMDCLRSSAVSDNTHQRLSSPEWFSRESGDFRPFITQCKLHFKCQTTAFLSNCSKIAYMISYLSGRAKAWARAKWNHCSAICNSLPLFIKTFTQIFQTLTPGHEVDKLLVALCQGKRNVLDFAIEFRMLAATSRWNQPGIVDAFLKGLSKRVKDHLMPLDLPLELDALVSLVSKINNRLFEQDQMRCR